MISTSDWNDCFTYVFEVILATLHLKQRRRIVIVVSLCVTFEYLSQKKTSLEGL